MAKWRFDTFEEWKRQVNQFIEEAVGLSADDLPDCPYHDWYDDRVAPARAAARAVRMAKE